VIAGFHPTSPLFPAIRVDRSAPFPAIQKTDVWGPRPIAAIRNATSSPPSTQTLSLGDQPYALVQAPPISIALPVAASDQRADFASEDVDLAVRRGDGRWPELEVERLCVEQLFPVCDAKPIRGRPR
jgi:hypothetical protein